MLNDSSHRDESHPKIQNDLKQVGSINVANTNVSMSTCDIIPNTYQKNSYPYSNIYMWLSICLVVCSIYLVLAQIMLDIFVKKQTEFE